MEMFIVVAHVFLCLFLILVVLLQPGKSDMGAALGGGGGQGAISAQSGTTLLGKITTAVAVAFMITSMTLAWFSNSASRGESVIDDDLLEELDSASDVAPKAIPAPVPSNLEEAPAPKEAAPAPEAPAEPAGEEAPAPAAPEGDDEDLGAE